MGNGIKQMFNQTFFLLRKSFSKESTICENGGPLTKLLNELGASKILRLDVIQDAQAVLNLPTPL